MHRQKRQRAARHVHCGCAARRSAAVGTCLLPPRARTPVPRHWPAFTISGASSHTVRHWATRVDLLGVHRVVHEVACTTCAGRGRVKRRAARSAAALNARSCSRSPLPAPKACPAPAPEARSPPARAAGPAARPRSAPCPARSPAPPAPPPRTPAAESAALPPNASPHRATERSSRPLRLGPVWLESGQFWATGPPGRRSVEASLRAQLQ